MSTKVSKNNIHIEDSYLISKRSDMQSVLDDIRANYSIECCEVLKRTDKSLIREWRTHNIFYNLHLFRSHTKDVDLSYPQSKLVEICYAIVSLLPIA